MRPHGSYTDDLRLAHVLADAVDQLTTSRFKAQDLEVSTKPDLTEVTDADKAAEQLVRSQLSRSRSRDQVIGEEFGSTGASPRQWVIDPIDGTSNFVRGVPVWGTLIGLIEDGRPVLIDFIVGKDAQVWPMVAAGTSNDEIMAARDIRPLFDDDESASGPVEIHQAMDGHQTVDNAPADRANQKDEQ